VFPLECSPTCILDQKRSFMWLGVFGVKIRFATFDSGSCKSKFVLYKDIHMDRTLRGYTLPIPQPSRLSVLMVMVVRSSIDELLIKSYRNKNGGAAQAQALQGDLHRLGSISVQSQGGNRVSLRPHGPCRICPCITNEAQRRPVQRLLPSLPICSSLMSVELHFY